MLMEASEAEGFRMLRRVAESGPRQAFAGVDEFFCGAFAAGRLVGIGGLNADPYIDDPRVGRVRRLYIAEDWRRHGVGTAIVETIIGAALGRFHRLRLRTDTSRGALFYETLGFTRVTEPNASHATDLPRQQQLRSL